ncbi:MAG TPA: hypothetical protein VJK72_04075 [Candidatus Nanoarchaeia archaeon]|nr:hypothetical protein [Candidatus Nanoarchaeia archaeon]
MKDIEELRAKFNRAYSNLPPSERSQVVAVIVKQPYSWEVVYNEITEKTALGTQILKKMKMVGIL